MKSKNTQSLKLLLTPIIIISILVTTSFQICGLVEFVSRVYTFKR